MNPAKVTLVGAGPGDADLLTLKAVKAIKAATVLLVDDLVGDDVVALAAPGTRVIHVGKRGGCKSIRLSSTLSCGLIPNRAVSRSTPGSRCVISSA